VETQIAVYSLEAGFLIVCNRAQYVDKLENNLNRIKSSASWSNFWWKG